MSLGKSVKEMTFETQIATGSCSDQLQNQGQEVLVKDTIYLDTIISW